MFQWLENLVAPAGYKARKEARDAEEGVLQEKITQAGIEHIEAADDLLKKAVEANKMGSGKNQREIQRLTDDVIDAMKARDR